MSNAIAIKSKIVNGVDVTALMDTIGAIKRNPEIAKFVDHQSQAPAAGVHLIDDQAARYGEFEEVR